MFRTVVIIYPTRSLEMASIWAISLADIRRSSRISAWTASHVCWSVEVDGRPLRGSSSTVKWPVLKRDIQVFTQLCEGHFSPSVWHISIWISFADFSWSHKYFITVLRSDDVKLPRASSISPSTCNDRCCTIRNQLILTQLHIKIWGFHIPTILFVYFNFKGPKLGTFQHPLVSFFLCLFHTSTYTLQIPYD